ncbi:MAG: PP2C family protein-serine/threonine phosphatase [Bacteroidota bacterium]
MQPVRSSRLSGFDGLLAALAVVGLALLIYLLPRLHPNAAASFALGVDGAEAAAAQFLIERGYAVDDLEARVFFTSSPALLDTLQRTLGRTKARTALLAHGEPLTGFRWQVDWSEPFDLDSDEGRGPSLTRFTVWLTQDGQPFELQVRSGGARTAATDARTLTRALYGDSPVEVVLDSLPAGALRFEILPDSGLAAVTPARAWQARDRIMLGMAEQWQQEAASGERSPTRAPLSATAAIAIAEVHLAGTLPGALRLEPYWVYPVPDAGSDVARVRFIAPNPVLAQSVVADIEVDAHGVLRSLRYAPSEAPDGAPLARGDRAAASAMSVDVSSTSMVPIVRWGLFAVVVLVIAVLFLRRLAARAVDARAALIDAGIVATATLAWSFLVFPSYYLQFGAPMTTALLFTLVGGLLWAAGLGLLVFVGAATTDSLARSVFVEKLDALALVRNGAWMNRPVGLSLLRGVLGGLALAGLPVLLWLVTPSRAVYAGDTFSFIQPGVLVAPHLFLSTLWVAFVILHYGLLGTGALLARWKSHAGVVVVGLGVLGALAIVGPVGQGVDPGWMRWVFAGAYALGVAALFWRTDALTAFWAVVFSIWTYRFAVVAIADASPADGEVGIVVLGLAVVAGIAAVALRMDQTGQAVQRVEPSYLTELATRERLEREVEIAREVQRSFLPATMPDVPGLDLAATCVPAEEVGGDYYDLVPLEDGPYGARRLAVVVGDVSGKGIQAAFYMTLVKGFLRTLCRMHTSPAAVLTRLNRLFCENVPRGAFISMIYGVFDLDAGTFTFARAGHNPLILKRTDHQTADLLQPSGLAIGLSGGPLFDDVLVDHTLDLLPGDTLVFYTDGFSEAVDDDRALYTDARLATVTADAMHEIADRPAAQLLGSLVADVRAFAADDGLRDDMTMVVVRVDPALVHPTGNGAATVVEA